MTEEQKFARLMKWIIISAIVGYILFVVIASLNEPYEPAASSGPTAGAIRLPDGSKIDDTLGRVMCESEIRKRLVSPATAKFGRPEWVQLGNRWKITSPVDSQNSFGALIRSMWECTIDGDANSIRVQQVR